MRGEREIGRLTLNTKESQFTVHCDALATYTSWCGTRSTEVKLLSVAGPATSIKAIGAALHTGGKSVYFTARDCGDIREYDKYRPDGKWEVYRTHLGCNTYHLVGWSKDEGFLATVSREALRRELVSSRLTTPLLTTADWIDYLIQRLKEARRWTEYKCFGCCCAGVLLDDTALDEIVTAGVRSGELSFT